GPTNGNPFLDVTFSAHFARIQADSAATKVTGFYDGDGNYRVRFMPDKPGQWHYVTESSSPALAGQNGEFTVTPLTAKNHGPVRVAHTYHFAYADGKAYKQIGTTCYAWVHQNDALQKQTLKTLGASPFNKVRFCIFPKHYD